MPNRLAALSFAVPLISAMSLHTRRQVAVALRRNDRRHRDGPSSDDLVCRYLPDTTLTFVNEAYCRFFRKSAADLVGTKFIDLIPEAARPEALRHVANLIATRERAEDEHEVIGPDGNLLWQHWTDEVIVDDAGQVSELQALGRDVTEHHRMAEALTQSNARNEALLRALPDMMFVLSSDGTYLDCHAPDQAALLLPRDQLLGKTMDDVMPMELAAMFRREFADVLATGQPSIVEYPLTLSSGLRYFEARIVAFEDRRSVIAIVRDVTDRRLSEDALRQAQADANAAQLSWMGALAASMAHEINQPLAVIEANG
jgi:PAS domain S-box-containing protein